MREPPADLDLAAVRACLRDDYGLAVRAVTFLPLGHDAAASAFRVETPDAGDYFLKARRRIVNQAGLLVPRHLHEQGVAGVAAPLPTRAGALWAEAGGYALVLYPFVDGRTGLEGGLSTEQWVAYGALLRQVHEVAVPPALAARLRRESFVPDGADTVRSLDAAIGEAGWVSHDPTAAALAAAWMARRGLIRALLARADSLARRLMATVPPLVLCHADIHTNNVLAGPDGRVWFVDWDEVMLAPRERDLMFAVGGGISRKLVGPADEALFLRGYLGSDAALIGATVGADAPMPNPLGLAYYRHAWAISDIGAYAEQALGRLPLGPTDRAESVEQFAGLFAPGEIVALALAEDTGPFLRDVRT